MADVEMFLTGRAPGYAPMQIAFACTTREPQAARLTFFDGGAEPATWDIAVDLLRAGLSGLVGEGDVRVWPDGVEVALRLSATRYGEGEATVLLARTEPEAFLDAAADLPPAPQPDFDAWLVSLNAPLARSDDAAKDAAIERIRQSLGDEEADR